MKTRLLKLALSAVVAALPIGAWADDVQNKATATWMFDQFGKGVTLFTNSNNVNVFDFDGLYAVVGVTDGGVVFAGNFNHRNVSFPYRFRKKSQKDFFFFC